MSLPYHRRLIARGLVAEVEHCADCEILHLHLGAFSLRLKPAVLRDLRDTLSRALDLLPHGADAAATSAGTDDASAHNCH